MGCAFLNEKFSICRNLKCSCVSKCWHPDKNTHGAPDGLQGWLANESRSLPSLYKINWMPFGVEIESRSDSRSEFSSRKPNSEKKIKPTHLVTSRRPCPTFIRVGCCTHQAGMLSEELILPNLVSWLVKRIGLMYGSKADFDSGPFLETILRCLLSIVTPFSAPRC